MEMKIPVARCEAESVQDILKQEIRPVPRALTEQDYTFVGSDPLPVERWLSQDFFEREKATVWKKTWQMACREEDIPKVGDHIIYEVNDDSLLVVRSAANEIRAFHNSCLHRGRRLRDMGGSVAQFRCPYHAFTWDLQGRSKLIPCQWDFPHIQQETFCLPQAKVDTWGGFVFVNFDLDAKPLSAFLGILPEHFKDWNYENKTKIAHVGKVAKFNWKVGIEAFIESFHVIQTHPQILPSTADANTQYDNYEGEHFNRMITAMAVPSPHLEHRPTEQEIVNAMSGRSKRTLGDADPSLLALPPGTTARQFMAEAARRMIQERAGLDLSRSTDSEMLDAIQYFVFPNFFPWGGYGSNIVYRFRPAKNSPDWCLMEVILIDNPPKEGPPPPPAQMRLLDEDEPWTNAPELGSLGAVFEQDFGNLPNVQKGLKASATGVVNLGNYQECRIRDLHRLIDRYIAESA